ncbi:MAG: (2Fe-2S)-binding protein [Thermoleophilia bacterium]|nr:(2Fe-2S)-binding protein [Thermoleophilia bacterium]
MTKSISFTLNGKATTLEADPERRLLWALRGELELTGAKYGCGSGYCGSCTVVVDGRPLRSCTTSLDKIAGKKILTIEGLAKEGKLHPLQRAFVEHGGLQCGYCTPGMIMSAYALLEANPQPTRDEIVDAMDRNLCRCAAHQRILAAIADAAGKGGPA